MTRFLIFLFLVLTACSSGPIAEVPSMQRDLLVDFQTACRHIDDMCTWKLTLLAPESNPPLAAVWFAKEPPEIVGDAAALLAIRRRYGPWSAVWIFGHEGGHVVDYRSGMFDLYQTSWAAELSADDAGGCVVALAGGDIKDVLPMITTVLLDGGKSHPPGEMRAAAAQRGYDRCESF